MVRMRVWVECGHAYTLDHQYDKDDLHPPILFMAQDIKKRQNGRTAERQNGGEFGSSQHSGRRTIWWARLLWDAGAIWLTFEAMSTLRRPDQKAVETFHSSSQLLEDWDKFWI